MSLPLALLLLVLLRPLLLLPLLFLPLFPLLLRRRMLLVPQFGAQYMVLVLLLRLLLILLQLPLSVVGGRRRGRSRWAEEGRNYSEDRDVRRGTSGRGSG